MTAPESPFRPEHFARVDESDDELFYVGPRLVTHIDEAAIAAAGRLYAEVLPQDDDILDLVAGAEALNALRQAVDRRPEDRIPKHKLLVFCFFL